MTTLLVATTGGHLAQLHDIAGRIPPDADTVWVTHENEQSASLLEHEDVVFVPYIGVRSVPGVLRALPHAHRLLRERKITRAVSTGSGIALGYLPYLALRGVECHYVESAARVTGPSITGRLLRWVPRVSLHTQYRSWARGRWHYGGSLFDAYERVPADERHDDAVLRVAVTVGTAAEFPMRRLVEALEPVLASDGKLATLSGRQVEVTWQTGCTPLDGLDIEATPFMPAKDLAERLRAADIVISHAGVGSAIAALDAGVLPVLVARDASLGEAGDGHQRELAAELVRRDLAVALEPADIDAEALLATLDWSVRRAATPPPFVLEA